MPTTPAKTDRTEKPTADQVADAKPDTPDEDVLSFPISRLRDEATEFFRAEGFGVADVAGAFAGVDLDTEVTLTDAKKRIREWHKAKANAQTDEG